MTATRVRRGYDPDEVEARPGQLDGVVAELRGGWRGALERAERAEHDGAAGGRPEERLGAIERRPAGLGEALRRPG